MCTHQNQFRNNNRSFALELRIFFKKLKHTQTVNISSILTVLVLYSTRTVSTVLSAPRTDSQRFPYKVGAKVGAHSTVQAVSSEHHTKEGMPSSHSFDVEAKSPFREETRPFLPLYLFQAAAASLSTRRPLPLVKCKELICLRVVCIVELIIHDVGI